MEEPGYESDFDNLYGDLDESIISHESFIEESVSFPEE